MISKIDSIELVGEACNGEELIRLTRKLQPDVLLIDVKMPKYTGIEATRIIKEEFPHIGIVAISSFDEEYLVLDMVNAGAKGYILKNTSAKEIENAVHAVYKDESYYTPDINVKLAQMVARGGLFSKSKKGDARFNERDMNIIKMICDGSSSKEIADAMNFETRSIERYRDRIMEKMGVRNAAALVTYAIKAGLYKITSRKPRKPKS